MTPTEDSESNIRETMIRLEAKIDVVLSRHEGKIDDLTRRQGETTSTLREHDARITANALTVAETRTQAANLATDVHGIEQQINTRSTGTVAWVAVGVAALAVVIEPLLQALLHNA